MTRSLESPGLLLLTWWERLGSLPGGTRLFSALLGRLVPYTGALGARVEELKPGHARVSLVQRRAVENHLRSVHAVALANLGEVTTGLAVLTALPRGARGIVTRLSTTYLHKARGHLVAECRCHPPSGLDESVTAIAEIRDEAHVIVARTEADWLIRPVSPARA
jgi:acyl-coenzyme A thioesterase PaaI-like protein